MKNRLRSRNRHLIELYMRGRPDYIGHTRSAGGDSLKDIGPEISVRTQHPARHSNTLNSAPSIHQRPVLGDKAQITRTH
eukprot:4013860-Pyramimonas_sp.AAC.1